MTTNELIVALRTMASYFVDRREAFVLSKAADRLEDIVDAVPVKHGRWEPSDYNGYCRCSVCCDCYIDKTWTIGGKWRYCPTCGAKMDGGGADGQ